MRPVYYGYAISDDYIMSLWDTQRNLDAGISPDKVSLGNKKKVWFKCPKCKNSWFTSICYVHDGCGCPICNKKGREKKAPLPKVPDIIPVKYVKYNILTLSYLANLWDYDKNTEDPERVSLFSNNKYFFKCKNCGYTFSSTPYRLYRYYSGCKNCKE